MMRTVGTTVRGIRAPIVKEGDNIINIVVDSVINASKYENFELRDKDIIGITESLIARTQGNYANQEDIAKDVNDKFHKDIGIVFPYIKQK